MSKTNFQPAIAKLNEAIEIIKRELDEKSEGLEQKIGRGFLEWAIEELEALKFLAMNDVPLKAQMEQIGLPRALADLGFYLAKDSKVDASLWAAFQACKDSYK